MQAVFVDNWTKATGRVLDGARYFPPLEARGEHDAQMFSSSPSGGSESMLLMYLMSITAAKDTIELSASYFVPDELAIKALVDASKRGVKIRIITPGDDIDSKIVRAASRALWGELLKAGIQIAEYQPTMYHVKAMVVDSLMVSVGSTNFDQRSFSINDEANLNIIDAKFAREQVAIFNDDWKRAKVITYAEWENRPLLEKAYSKLASLASEQL
jgi:cardiolipin synthase